MTNSDPVPADSSGAGAGKLDLDGLSDLLGFNLRQAQVAVYRDFQAALASLDLTQKQGAVLQLIGANPAVSQVDLGATLGVDRASMMALVEKLRKRGFLVRRRSTEDRRRQELFLTGAGEEALTVSKRLIAEHEQRFVARFAEPDLEALLNALRRIHQQA